jgi:hypothetical protein
VARVATTRHQLRLSFAMSMIKVLAVLPFLGILVGSVFLNQVTPLVL